MNPNSRQVGGQHYAAEFQHWDFVVLLGMGYLEGCATKYVLRWRQKGGKQDLEKAAHYVEKMLDLLDRGHYRRSGIVSDEALSRMINSYPHPVLFFERSVLDLLMRWNTRSDLEHAASQIKTLLTHKEMPDGSQAQT